MAAGLTNRQIAERLGSQSATVKKQVETILRRLGVDNRTKAAGVKGRSDYSLKLFAWWSQWNLDIKKAEWWRVVQLIDPKTVLTWAKKKHAVGDMDAAMFEIYETVCHAAIEQAQEDGA